MLLSILSAVLVVIVVIFFFKLLKSLIKALFLGLVLVVLLAAAFSFVAYTDYHTLSSRPAVAVLEEGNHTYLRTGLATSLDALLGSVPGNDTNTTVVRFRLSDVLAALPDPVNVNGDTVGKTLFSGQIRNGDATAAREALALYLSGLSRTSLLSALRSGAITVTPEPLSVKLLKLV